MTNYTIFDQQEVRRLVGPFIALSNQLITPLKYEAISPDVFALLVRIYDEREEYYVSLEFDYMGSIDEARRTIEQWHGGLVVGFVEVDGAIVIDMPGSYRAVLARVSIQGDS